MHFDTLTYAPIDLDAIDVSYMTEEARQYLNGYHAQVFDKISPFLEPDEKEWLKEVTRAV